jgi:aminoglycoside 6'-N-acetyltransferase
MELRKATMADAAILTYWDAKPHVVAATGADDVENWSDALSTDPEWRDTLIAELSGRPIGVIQVIDPLKEVTHYWGDIAPHFRAIDIWIGEESDLGHGHGTQMMTLALDMCFEEASVVAVLIDPLESNSRARRFYERLGFIAQGLRVFGDDHCMVYRLERTSWTRRRP